MRHIIFLANCSKCDDPPHLIFSRNAQNCAFSLIDLVIDTEEGGPGMIFDNSVNIDQ